MRGQCDAPDSEGTRAKQRPSSRRPAWHRYLVSATALHLGWELLHFPLYDLERFAALWRSELFPVLCVGADVGIATGALALALKLVDNGWPARHGRRVAGLTVAFGLAFTVISEWVNVYLFETWAYADSMPVIPVVGIGLSPVAQWLVVPLGCLWWAHRPSA